MNKRQLRRMAGDWIKKASRFDVWSEAMRFCAEQIMTLIRKPKRRGLHHDHCSEN